MIGLMRTASKWLRPVVDSFRNYVDDHFEEMAERQLSPEQLFLDRAALLGLSAPDWVSLTGGLRFLGAN